MVICPEKKYIEGSNLLVDAERKSWMISDSNPNDVATDIDTQGLVVEISQLLTRMRMCRLCGGMVVDLSTGKVYCGQDTPAMVLERNERIIAN